jgi:two-component system, NtrC family, response regulator
VGRTESRDEDGCLIPEENGNNPPAYRLDSMERHTIVKVLEETKGDKIAAARILGIGKTTIYRKLRQYRQVRAEAEERRG